VYVGVREAIDGGKRSILRLGRCTPEKSHLATVFRILNLAHNFIFKKYHGIKYTGGKNVVVIIYFTMQLEPRQHRVE
jgi:hypothetical protein